ncbi:putative H(+)-transporting two-sector ATPase [Helianthus annuus]|nr:putative H(+)-transporting two-sector ATPase [Helianthus annuus]
MNPSSFSLFHRCVLCLCWGVGEQRTREGNDLYREMMESGVIKLGDKPREQVCSCVWSNERTPGARARGSFQVSFFTSLSKKTG